MLNDGSYAYAKACGIIGKSFLGKRIASLSGLHVLSELDRLIFSGVQRELPGKELLLDLEHRILERAVRHIFKIVNSFSKPPEILVRMIKDYEYSDLKVCLQHIAAGKKNIPLLSNIGRFRTVRFNKFPDITAMIRGTEFAFLLSEIKTSQPGSMDFASIETKLDTRYYLGLAESLQWLSPNDRFIAERVLADEISLRNCVWALRLRTYYQKSPDEADKYLMNIRLHGGTNLKLHSLAADAHKSLDLPLDNRAPWHGWKWEKMLNPEEASVHWTANPRYFQNAASQYMYNLALRCFRHAPMSISALLCFIRLEQFEEDLLTSVAEGLALGMDSSSVFKLLEVSR